MKEQKRWDLYNDFSLWGHTDRFSKMLARYEIFKQVIEMPGDIVEGGVLKGAGMLYWAKLIEIFKGVLPFLSMVFVAMIILYTFPEIAMWLPKVVYGR